MRDRRSDMASGSFSASQAALPESARAIFISNQIAMVPLYYVLPLIAPGLLGLLGGDGKGSLKFPCSISWMCRKGAARYSTLVLWNLGWLLMIRAFLNDGDFAAMTSTDLYRAAFMIQMFVTGFVCVVLTPMQGKDVAMGSRDQLHCYAAMLYVVADHWVANEFVLGVPTFSPFGLGFIVSTLLCGSCQSLRADDDRLSRQLYVRSGAQRCFTSFASFAWWIELGFMLNEMALFLIFLFGMTSGVTVV